MSTDRHIDTKIIDFKSKRDTLRLWEDVAEGLGLVTEVSPNEWPRNALIRFAKEAGQNPAQAYHWLLSDFFEDLWASEAEGPDDTICGWDYFDKLKDPCMDDMVTGYLLARLRGHARRVAASDDAE